eukprot:15470117-Alexandrium_andersonii.AAC.1
MVRNLVFVMKLSCNYDGWADLSTAKFFTTVHNLNSATGAMLKPLSQNPNVFSEGYEFFVMDRL